MAKEKLEAIAASTSLWLSFWRVPDLLLMSHFWKRSVVVSDSLGLDSLRRIGRYDDRPDNHLIRLVRHRAGDAAVHRRPQCQRVAKEERHAQ